MVNETTSVFKNMAGKARQIRRILQALALVLLAGLVIPERFAVPVEGASPSDWNTNSFWFYPWGASGVHKGIDIFAPRGKAVRAATSGIVVYRGSIQLGGNILVILGPKWRFHYYAHLDTAIVHAGEYVSRGETVGTVGTTGNAAGKQPHLHYVILSMFPYPWYFDTGMQGWKKMFYLNPTPKIIAAGSSK